MKNFNLDKNNALIFIIGGLSVINVAVQFTTRNYLSIANSAVGLVGLALFLRNNGTFRYLIWTWIAAQAIIIDHTVTDHAAGVVTEAPIFDLSQTFKIKIGFYASGNTNSYGLNFNAVVILYFFLFRNLKTSSFIGRSIGLMFMRGDLDLQAEEGTAASISQRVNLDGDDNWLLAHLNAPIRFNQSEYDRVLVYAEDGLLTHTFRLVPATINVGSGTYPTVQFERAEWIMIE